MMLIERLIDWVLTISELFGLFVLSSRTESFADDQETETATTDTPIQVCDA